MDGYQFFGNLRIKSVKYAKYLWMVTSFLVIYV